MHCSACPMASPLVDCPFVRRTRCQDDELYAEGDPASFVWLVAEGVLAGTQSALDGTERVSSVYTEGDLLGVEALYLARYVESVRALGHAEVCACSRDSFQRWLGRVVSPARVAFHQLLRMRLRSLGHAVPEEVPSDSEPTLEIPMRAEATETPP